eukprot:NODE_122_length_1466_cov_725.252427_g117_i1.p1 GENE.NODE_122_length_1466_cov_725.252427_g117_i1~~NODE_122_length_1466_cov_725.252427_g117_i1.p1  ORF type:complete len:218 (+),score=60.99 NODE_122_length_1466_cov_725.252427_g117_i1:208-861(+)
MEAALKFHGDEVAISFSGAEDVALVHLASETGLPFRVFSLDTGRLHPETYRYLQEVSDYYGVEIEYCFPEATDVETLVRAKGLYSFFKDGHKECCDVRKVAPLKRQLSTLRGWITGQRQDQSVTRTGVPLVHIDGAFKGTENGDLIKWNPLANVSSADIWKLIRKEGIPYNPLHNKGFVSIGCEPCTKPILPGQHEREGRWWWEDSAQKECGLHKQK